MNSNEKTMINYQKLLTEINRIAMKDKDIQPKIYREIVKLIRVEAIRLIHSLKKILTLIYSLCTQNTMFKAIKEQMKRNILKDLLTK